MDSYETENRRRIYEVIRILIKYKSRILTIMANNDKTLDNERGANNDRSNF